MAWPRCVSASGKVWRLLSRASELTIDRCRLQYQWHGPPAGQAPTIVFLHEGLGSITRWRALPAAICARLGWGGLVYNRQGYGGSDPWRPPLLPRFMHREALEVLDCWTPSRFNNRCCLATATAARSR